MTIELRALGLANDVWRLKLYLKGRERDCMCLEKIRELNWWQ